MNFDTVNLFNITLSQVIELRIKKQGLQDLQERNKWRLSSVGKPKLIWKEITL